jgi:hypothetical protein
MSLVQNCQMSVRSRNHVTKSQFDKGVTTNYYKRDGGIKSILDKDVGEGTNPGSVIGTIREETKKQDQPVYIVSSSVTRSVAELDVRMWKQIHLSCWSCVLVHSEIVSRQMIFLSELGR